LFQQSEAFEDGFGSPRKSSRLSIKTDSAKKRVEFQLKNNVEQGKKCLFHHDCL